MKQALKKKTKYRWRLVKKDDEGQEVMNILFKTAKDLSKHTGFKTNFIYDFNNPKKRKRYSFKTVELCERMRGLSITKL